MNTQVIWDKLRAENIVSGEMPIQGQLNHPWYIRLMQGFAGWLAALFLVGFFAFAFEFLFKTPNRVLLFSIGAMCSIVSYLIFRSKKSDFLAQFAMAISLCGQTLVGIALFWNFSMRNENAFFILGAYQLALTFLLPNYLHRLLTAGFALTALLIGLNLHGIWGLGTAFSATAVSFIWLKENHWSIKKQLWEPIGYGLVITLIISQSLLVGKDLLFWSRGHNNTWLFSHAPLLASVLVALVLLNVLWVIVKENKLAIDSKEAVFIAIVGGVFVLISFKIHGLSTGLLITLLGFMRGRKVLLALGLFAIVGFFSWYYYNLEQTLLVKSIILMVLGLVMLVAYFVHKSIYSPKTQSYTIAKSTFKFKKLNLASALVLAIIAVVLLGVNYSIAQKENLIATGDKLLFRLRPNDPLSKIQGFYMLVNSEVANKIYTELFNNKTNYGDIYKQLNKTTQGYVIVEKGEYDVVNFVELYTDQELKENQYKLPFKYRNYRIQLTTDAFYFQEGKAQHYNKAVYGEYRYKNGELILVNLIDKDFKVL